MKFNMDVRVNKTLHLVLKRKWWDMIASGEKKEEYREVCHYWAIRLLDEQYRWYSQNTDYPKDFDWWLFWKLATKSISFREYSKVCFHLGYTNTTMTFNIVTMFMAIGTEYIQGVVRQNDNYLIILDTRRLFSAKELQKILDPDA